MRRLLLISYWYPPAVGAAAERIAAFARYLPEYGWEADVLTAGRAGSSPNVGPGRVRRVADRWAAKEPAFADYDPRRRSSWVKARLRDFVFPDRFGAWARRAIAEGTDAIREGRPDLIMASFPPASAVVVGLDLHRRTGIPLVLDYRDRWFGPGGYEPRRAAARRRHEQLEHEAVSSARGVTCVSQAMADAISAEHGIPRDRVVVISNGYDPGISPDKDAPPPRTAPGSCGAGPSGDERLTLCHVGTVIHRNRPDVFLESIRRLRLANRLLNVRFRFVGNLSQSYVSALGLGEVVEVTGLISRHDARREMEAAATLLLLTGGYVGRWGHNAKLFEYLRAGPPILCLEEEPGSHDRALLERVARDRSFFADIADPDGIAAAIESIRLAAGAASPDAPSPGKAPGVTGLEVYDRRVTAGALAEALSGCL